MKSIGLGICILLALGFSLFVAVLLYVYVGLLRNGDKLRKKLAGLGRTLTLQETKALVSRGEGTIVVEYPTVGWNVGRLWWAPAGVVVNASTEARDEESMCSAADSQNFDALIDSDTGVAKIVCSFIFAHRIRPFLRRHFGIETCTSVFTGGVEFERRLAELRKPDGAKDH